MRAASAKGAPLSTLIVIPARLGATRLPRKPLRLLGGRPLIVRVWERLAAMAIADRMVVATDAQSVADAVRSAGGEAVLTRADHPSGTDRVAEVAALPEHSRYDVVINVQGDEPYVTEASIRGAVGFVERGVFPLGTAAFAAGPSVLADPATVKVVCGSDGRALYFSRAPIPFLREVADADVRDGLVRAHIGVYAYTRQALEQWVSLPPHPLEVSERLEQLRAIANGLAMGVATVSRVPGGGIDTEDDLALANARWGDHQPSEAGKH
jgi:3-deoxy-manno-octulosonate cytidylyltransferase (CMP-KDO synthetase)